MTFPLALGTPGGGTVGCLRIARALAARGVSVCVLPLTTHAGLGAHRPRCPDDLVGRDRWEELRDAGVEVTPVEPAASYRHDHRVMRVAVAAALQRRPAAAVVGWHHEFASLPAWLRRRGVASGVIAAGQYEHLAAEPVPLLPGPGWWRRRRQRALIAGAMSADVVLSISAFLGGVVRAVFALDPARIAVVPWGVEPIFQRPSRPASASVERLLFYGSAAPRKGIPDTLAALGAIAAAGGPPWRLRLVAWDREQTARLAAEHGITERVELLEPMPHEALVRQLEWAQLAILPSTYESFGLACAECQAAGLPVIAYDVGGVGEVVADGESGWLVPVGDRAALRGAIEAALADPGEVARRGAAGAARARAFTWERTAELIVERLDAVRGRG